MYHLGIGKNSTAVQVKSPCILGHVKSIYEYTYCNHYCNNLYSMS